MDKNTEITLVLGGCRSGKTAFALKEAQKNAGRRIYLASCPVMDPEMNERIENHRKERKNLGFETMEEEIDPAGAVRKAGEFQVLVFDCITLWVSNLLFQEEKGEDRLTETKIKELSEDLASACRTSGKKSIIISNETGLGIVPDNALSRRFRDLAGIANQTIASLADEVYFTAAGIPVKIK